MPDPAILARADQELARLGDGLERMIAVVAESRRVTQGDRVKIVGSVWPQLFRSGASIEHVTLMLLLALLELDRTRTERTGGELPP